MRIYWLLKHINFLLSSKINIKKDFVDDIAKELKYAGYRIMNVYPELENISNAIVKQVDAYFK